MKKVAIIIILIGTLTFTGCNNKLVTSSSIKPSNNKKDSIKFNDKSHQKYTFAPCADLSIITEEQKNFLQESLDKIGDIKKDTIGIIPIGLPFYDENGNLRVNVFIRNGHDFEIYNLNARLTLNVDNIGVTSGNSLLDVKILGYLPSKMSRPITIVFSPTQIQDNKISFENKHIELINITEYEHK